MFSILFYEFGENDTPTNEPCPYCKQHRVEQIITSATPLADPYAIGRYHHSDGWRSILKGIKDRNPNSNINVP